MCRRQDVGALVLVVLPFLSSACGGSDPASVWAVSIDTLPGGTVHVVNTPPPHESGPTWVLEEELRIGSVDEVGPASFGQLKGLVVTDDERIVVLDALAQEVRVFGPDGLHFATHGGKGAGPGELKGAFGLMISPRGQLWVPDYRNARMSVYDPAGGFLESYPLPIPIGGFMYRGAMDASGRVLEPSSTLGPPWRGLLRVYGPAMAVTDSVFLPEGPEIDQKDPPGSFYWEAPDGRGFGYVAIPFFPTVGLLLDPGGSVWSTGALDPSYRILRWIPGGDTTLVLETRRPPVAVPAAVRDSAIDSVREQLRELGAAKQDWSKVPEVWPAIASMFLAEDGDLWVQVASPDTFRRYDVYERNGRYRRSVATSLNVLSWLHPVVREDQFWAVVTDDLDVPFVVRTRIVPADLD